jgi:hypothetical protein
MKGLKLNPEALKHHGLRRGAYDGARKRLFVLFQSNGDGTEMAREFDRAGERDEAAWRELMHRARGGDWRHGF